MRQRRWKAIRRLSRTGDLPMLRFRCREAEKRYREMVRLKGPDVIVEAFMATWHDREFALSLAEGYYDPRSDICQHVLRGLARGGFETTPEELDEMRRRMLKAFTPVLLEYGYPVEFGCAIRVLQAGAKIGWKWPG